MNIDRNFDDLAPRFQRNVYGGMKGRIRLAVLQKDMHEFYPQVILPAGEKPLRILDAGSGRGPFSLGLAELGHELTLCDLSEEMLKLATADIIERGIAERVQLVHSAIQDLPSSKHGLYDLVLCHAVLEWVHQPQELIEHLLRQLKIGGLLSLTFYNLNGMIYKNLLRTNYSKILQEDYSGFRGSLTPTYPRHPEEVMQWLSAQPLDILCHSGMRVFHDYILNPEDRAREPETVLSMELQLSRQLPFRDLGRYQHVMGRKRAGAEVGVSSK
jgi:S-adenosylmethionine-dependent methyltransferase